MLTERPGATITMLKNMQFIVTIASVCGMRITDADFRFNVLTLCTCVVISTFKLLGVYTICINRLNVFLVLETLCLYGLTIPVSIPH